MRNRRIREVERKLWDEDFEKIRLKKSKKKALVLCTIIAFCFFAVFVRLVVLMIFDHDVLSQKAERQYRKIKTLKAQRGMIWDREMRPMALTIEADSLYAVPSKIKDMKGLSLKLASFIDVSAERINKKLLARKDKDFIWLTREMEKDTASRISKLKNDFKLEEELGILTETKRYYPNAQRASHIVGYTSIDDDGLSGIELIYNDYLEGKAKKIQLSKDARGYSLSKDVEDNLPGDSLLLTIDIGLQNIVEREIEDAVIRWEAEAAVAIMVNPVKGEILALANRPTYDPNFAGRAKAANRRNRAITDVYEPGSTFKVILAAAAIEEGVVTPDEKFDVSKGSIKVPGGFIHDGHKNKILTFKEVIQKSSNVGAVQAGFMLGEKKFYQYIKRFGFGEKTGIDLPGEVRGILRSTENWSGRSLPSISIGQEVAVTPLQLLMAYSAIANGGKLMRPYIVSEIISPSGEIIKSVSPEIKRRVISVESSRIIRDILKTVVEEGGTAQNAFIAGSLVAGKTGTAQIIDSKTGRYSEDDFVSSFVGFVPADNPQIALIVVVYKPRVARYGGVVAAPVFRNIIEQSFVYLNIPMEREENNVLLISSSR